MSVVLQTTLTESIAMKTTLEGFLENKNPAAIFSINFTGSIKKRIIFFPPTNMVLFYKSKYLCPLCFSLIPSIEIQLLNFFNPVSSSTRIINCMCVSAYMVNDHVLAFLISLKITVNINMYSIFIQRLH